MRPSSKPIKELNKDELIKIALEMKNGSMYREACIFELTRRTEVFKAERRLLHPDIAEKEYKENIMELYNNIKEDYRG